MSAMTETTNAYQAVDELQGLLDEAKSEGDSTNRAIALNEAWTFAVYDLAPKIADERRAAVRQMRADGLLVREVAEALGITEARVSQICQ